METKTCSICDQTKNIEEFRRLTGLKNKFNKSCATCIDRPKARYAENKEQIKVYQRAYREQNKEYFSEYRKEWGKVNKDTLSAWENKRYDEDPTFKKIKTTRQKLRGLINKALEFEAVLGCSFEEFKKHIESKFKEGMSWSNWGKGDGKWSLDHIDPLSKMDSIDNANFYTNLRPLWCHENSKKGNK